MSGERGTQSRRATAVRALEFLPAELRCCCRAVRFEGASRFPGVGLSMPRWIISPSTSQCAGVSQRGLLSSFCFQGMQVNSIIWVLSLDFRLLFIYRKDILYARRLFNSNLNQCYTAFSLLPITGTSLWTFLRASSFSKFEKKFPFWRTVLTICRTK